MGLPHGTTWLGHAKESFKAPAEYDGWKQAAVINVASRLSQIGFEKSV